MLINPRPSLTRQARKHFPQNAKMAAKWVLQKRYLAERKIIIRPWWGLR